MYDPVAQKKYRNKFKREHGVSYDSEYRRRAKSRRVPPRFITPEYAREARLRLFYNLSVSEFQEILIKQQGRCAACGVVLTTEGRRKDRACVDHDHLTGAIRGILCSRCNTALGFLDDSVQKILGLLHYREKF